MSLINISELAFGYDRSAENVFENATINPDTSRQSGLTERNSRGKTMLRLLAWELEYSGKITSAVDFEFSLPYRSRNTHDRH